MILSDLSYTILCTMINLAAINFTCNSYSLTCTHIVDINETLWPC